VNDSNLRRAVRGRRAGWLLSTVTLVLVFIAGFTTARLRPDHAATPRWISGTVTWSNADIHRVLFEADDNSDDSGEYEVAAIGRWNRKGGAHFSSGLPICLATAGTEFVRTDRRRVELGVISVREPDESVYRVAVVVRCLT
jgi:hypothetical protein